MQHVKVSMEREKIGNGYYALGVDAATPSKDVADFVSRAVQEAFSVPDDKVCVVSAEEARLRVNYTAPLVKVNG